MILAFGAASLVGVALKRRSDVTVVHCLSPADKHDAGVRVEDPEDVAALVGALKPKAILYCHAVCDVGRCEDHPGWAHEVNVGGVGNLLRAVGKGTRVVYVSSDHIFGGDGVYRESSTARPISVYGRTRVLAEELVRAHENALIVRPGLEIGRAHV